MPRPVGLRSVWKQTGLDWCISFSLSSHSTVLLNCAFHLSCPLCLILMSSFQVSFDEDSFGIFLPSASLSPFLQGAFVGTRCVWFYPLWKSATVIAKVPLFGFGGIMIFGFSAVLLYAFCWSHLSYFSSSFFWIKFSYASGCFTSACCLYCVSGYVTFWYVPVTGIGWWAFSPFTRAD